MIIEANIKYIKIKYIDKRWKYYSHLKCDHCETEYCYSYNGKKMVYKRKLHFCSIKCRNLSQEFGKLKTNIEKTNIERYGVYNAILNKEIKEKQQKIMIEKYGHISPFKNKKVQEK